jgi:hypothetical protein
MNHRGGRARPPSLCRSGPGGARAPASPVAQGPRAVRWAPGQVVWESWSLGIFQFLSLGKVTPRHPRGVRGQFGGQAAFFK